MNRRHVLLGIAGALVVVVVVLAVFWPVARGAFVNWDDDRILIENPHWRGLDRAHLSWMVGTMHGGVYQPLGWLAFAAQHALWGMDPGAYHRISLAVHVANALAFYVLCVLLLPFAGAARFATATLAALLFAVHPLRVECVAWASCQPYLWAGLFWISAIVIYVVGLRSGRPGARWLGLAGAIVLFGVSLLCKTIGVALPLVLLVLDVYPLRRARRFGVLLAEKLPFALIAVAIAWQALGATRIAEAGKGKLVVAFDAIVFYLVKTVVPFGLSPFYPRRTELVLFDVRNSIDLALVFLITAAAAFLAWRGWPALAAGWAVYLVLLAPVLGFVWHGEQRAADRYTYLSCLPWALLAGGAFGVLWVRWRGPILRAATALAALVAVGLLAAASSRQTAVWHDSVSLWKHALEVAPRSTTAMVNLGLALPETEQAAALDLYRRALEIEPHNFTAWKGLGIALSQLGRVPQAIHAYERALLIRPDDPGVLYNIATLHAESGDFVRARQLYARVLEIEPSDYRAMTNLGATLAREERFGDAIQWYRRALALHPHNASAWLNLGLSLARTGEPSETIEAFRQAAAAYAMAGETQQAVQAIDRALAAARRAAADDLVQQLEREAETYRSSGR